MEARDPTPAIKKEVIQKKKLLASKSGAMDVDASFDKSLWFSNKGRNDSRILDLAAVLAEEDHNRFVAEAKGRGRGEGAEKIDGCQGLTRREAERVLHSGVDADSHLLKGPVKHVAARVTSVIAAAFMLVKREREIAAAAISAEKNSRGETHLVLCKLEELERERTQLLTETAIKRQTFELMTTQQREKDEELSERHEEIVALKHHVAYLRQEHAAECKTKESRYEHTQQGLEKKIKALEEELESATTKKEGEKEKDRATENAREREWKREKTQLLRNNFKSHLLSVIVFVLPRIAGKIL